MRKAKIIKSLRAENKSLSDRLHRASVVREDLELQLQSAFEELEQAEEEIASLRKRESEWANSFNAAVAMIEGGEKNEQSADIIP